MGNQPSIIVMFSDVTTGRITLMEFQMGKTQEEMMIDYIIDRLHLLVDEQRYEDAIAYYEEHSETISAIVQPTSRPDFLI